jgi:hypothetical protein
VKQQDAGDDDHPHQEQRDGADAEHAGAAVEPEKVRLREPNWPPRVLQIANAYHNQLELPVLFYVVMLLAMITKTLDVVIYLLAWMFVLSRLVHAYIHVTSNRLDRRTGAFGIGLIALFLMWVIIVARILLFSAG